MNSNEELSNAASEEPRGETPSEIEAKPEEAAASEPSKAEIEPVVETDAESPLRLTLVPWLKAIEAPEGAPKPVVRPAWRFDPLGIAASLAALGFIFVGTIAGYDHIYATSAIAGRSQETDSLVKTVATLQTRLESIEAAHSQEQSAELHKTLNEIRATAAVAQGYGASLGQLAQRVDRLEKDENARLDKLAERIDQSASSRFGEIVSRLDKLEKKPAAVALAAPPPPAPPSPSPAPAKAAAIPSMPPNVSNDITGSIERPKSILRGYALEDIRDGMALVDGRDGPYTVSPGDVLPGAGRVLKIERRGRDWVVVTTLGIITTPQEP